MVQDLYPRFSADLIQVALTDTPVVMLSGARQSGKTTLVRSLLTADERRRYLTLDDDTVLAGAKADPIGFVRELDRAIIDEVQRAPELLRAIKLSVDEDRRPGRFILTGSANVLAMPDLSESLAGRMAEIPLFTLSPSEVLGERPSFLERAFEGKTVAPPSQAVVGEALVHQVLGGGYPEMLKRTDPERRAAWAREYANTLVRRDVIDVADVERQRGLRRLFRVLAHHSAALANFSKMAGQVGIDDKTARRYVTVLEQLFVVRRVEPWFRNRLNRLVKTPKLMFLDSGLMAGVVGATPERLAEDRSAFGALLETYVFAEILRQASWLTAGSELFHFRDRYQHEVDVVVETDAGLVVGLEVKASATVRSEHFRGLKKLRQAVGEPFRQGIVLYDGTEVVPFEDQLAAVPISCLWNVR